MGLEPIGFFRIPPNYTELSEEEQREVAEAIGEKIRDALLRKDADRSPGRTPSGTPCSPAIVAAVPSRSAASAGCEGVENVRECGVDMSG